MPSTAILRCYCLQWSNQIYCVCVCFFCYDFMNSAGGSSVALTVISPVYGSSNGSGVPSHYNSPYAMPSLHPSSSPSGSQAPPPPPPPPIMTASTTPTSRGLHHQPSMRGGITSPQPVGVFTLIEITLSLIWVVFASCSLFFQVLLLFFILLRIPMLVQGIVSFVDVFLSDDSDA